MTSLTDTQAAMGGNRRETYGGGTTDYRIRKNGARLHESATRRSDHVVERR